MKIFKNRLEMINSFDKNLKICELGVFVGDFSKEIYEFCKPKELYLIDLFEGYFGSGDKDGNNYRMVRLEDELIKIKEFFRENGNVKIFKSKTIDFLNSVKDEYFDIIYIDADHSYHSVYNDLLLSRMKTKHMGLICGHDYVVNTEAKKAVDDFCSENNLNIECLTQDGCPSFIIINKKNENPYI